MTIPFVRDMDPAYGQVVEESALVRRVTAENPGPFTYLGTNTFIVGRAQVAVIDPGPDDTGHVQAVTRALAGETVLAILVTHTHLDHSPASRELAARVGGVLRGYGPLDLDGHDRMFVPDGPLRDGDEVHGPGWTLRALHTPGHTSNHLCFELPEERTLFTGDHLMAWSTSVVTPPDGDMAAYIASLERLRSGSWATFRPSHGPATNDPQVFVEAFLEHRRERERQVLDAIAAGSAAVPDLVKRVYADVDESLHAPAGQSLLALLRVLEADGRVRRGPGADLEAIFSLP